MSQSVRVGALALGIAITSTVVAQSLDFRRPDQVPPSWIQFSKLVKYRFEERIGSDDPIAARFRIYLKVHRGREDGPPPVLTVRAWVEPDGRIARVSFPAFKDA